MLSAKSVPLSPQTSAFLKAKATLGLAWDSGLRQWQTTDENGQAYIDNIFEQ